MATMNNIILSLKKLKTKAKDLGASDVKIISTTVIPVEDEIIELCKEPLCASYGNSIYCPPHAMKPQRFRELLTKYEDAVIFKIDASSKILLSKKRFDEFRKIYEIATRLESFAMEDGFSESEGFAAGSCKPVFCPEYQCQAIIDGKTCRYPDKARPSMEAVGINVFKLVREVGWEINKITANSDPDSVQNGLLAGMLLVG
jgi:predicted metal-binding protein